MHLCLYGTGFIILITSWPLCHAASTNVQTKYAVMFIVFAECISNICMSDACVSLESGGKKDHWGNDISQAVLWSIQQLIIQWKQTECNLACYVLLISFVVVKTTSLYSAFCRIGNLFTECLYRNTTLLQKTKINLIYWVYAIATTPSILASLYLHLLFSWLEI